jgi:uncharacterized repeat protein (TIGR01451 family)
MTQQARHRLWLLLSLSLLLVLGQSAVAAPEVPWPVVTLSKSVSPSSTDPGGTVTYTITLTNSGDVAAQGVTVVDTLPNGFGYQYGSSRVYANGILISSSNPNVSGRNLTWSNLSVPERRGDSFYGMHTFVQERCETWYFSWQLDRVRELMGYGAWVKQLFYGITPQTQGPAGRARRLLLAQAARRLAGQLQLYRLGLPAGGSRAAASRWPPPLH